MRDIHKPGRPSPKRAPVIDVRHADCPSGGTHRIACDDDQVWRCQGCRETWADLDTEARKTGTQPKPTITVCGCGAKLMSDRRWQEASSEVRKQWQAEGYARRAKGMCVRCARRVGRAA